MWNINILDFYSTTDIFPLIVGLEWKLSELGVVKTSLKENPDTKNQIQDMLTVSLKGAGTSARHRDPDDSDEDDD